MSIFVLNMPFSIEKRISFSALSSKMKRQFVWQKAMRIKQDLPTYNASIYLRTECSERKKRRGPNKNKNPRVQNCIIIRAANLIRIAIYAGGFNAWINLQAKQVYHIYNARIYWRTEVRHA
jgi:hypothetical protein